MTHCDVCQAEDRITVTLGLGDCPNCGEDTTISLCTQCYDEKIRCSMEPRLVACEKCSILLAQSSPGSEALN